MKFSRLAILAVLTAATGCSMPGANMKVDNNDDADISIDERINVRSVSPQLLAEMASENQAPSSTRNESLEAEIAAYDYKIGVADVLNITIWDHPELTIPAGSFRSAADSGNWVHADGTIFYPYIGRVEVAGKTVSEVRDLVAERLSNFIESPQVDVSISAFRSQKVHVTGEVKVPGPQPVTNVPLTLIDALNLAGGVDEQADWHRVVLSRGGEDTVVDLQALMQYGDLTHNVLLEHGDIIHVPRNDNAQVYVMGAVVESQVLRMGRNNMSLTEALTHVGGINDSVADASGVFVIRATQEQDKLATIYQLNMEDASSLVLASRFELEPTDVIYVATEPVAVWNRLMMQLLPTVTALRYATDSYRFLDE